MCGHPRHAHCYGDLAHLLPSRDDGFADITISDDMITLSAFRLEKGEASLNAGKAATLDLINEFGANSYTEDEEKLLSETRNSFSERHGTAFSCQDFLRFMRYPRYYGR